MLQELKENYGYLFEDSLINEISKVSFIKNIPEGETLIEIGDFIKFMPLLVYGAAKIMREDEKGDELILYFLEKGDTCAMTLTCCMGNSKSEVRAIAESDARIILIPVHKMSEWISKFPSWQNFILQSYHTRMKEMLEAIDTLAFLKMDERLLKYLKDKAMINRNNLIQVTHQEIANDLHTSRVVISRLLKALEIKGEIKLNRNQIKILNL
ncbi:Crp/Fnr family transcriptional regulator [Bacteroidota bacterium]